MELTMHMQNGLYYAPY